jgi:lysophospholipase L1-like esterase
VINRGMNGYNSRWGAAVLPLILEEILGPTASPLVSVGDGEYIEIDSDDRTAANASCPSSVNIHELLTDDTQSKSFVEKQGRRTRHPKYTFLIGFGANDSCLPDGPHSRNHVHIKEYANNLMRIIRMIQTWNAKETAVALMTPPPCDTELQSPSRDNENVTRLYAEACIQVASAMSIPVVDLWNGMQLPIAKNKDGQDGDSSHLYKSRQHWKGDYLSDGLHLTAMGNYRLYELVIDVLDRSDKVEANGNLGLGLSVATLARTYPDHSMIDATHPQKTFDNGSL